MSPPTEHRADQLGSVIHRAVQAVIAGGLSDPRLDAMITVIDVKVTADRSTAVISVSVMPEKHESRVIHALRDASRHIRRQAGEAIEVHKLPELVFKLDRTNKKQAELLDAMARVRAEREAHAADADASPPDSQKTEDP